MSEPIHLKSLYGYRNNDFIKGGIAALLYFSDTVNAKDVLIADIEYWINELSANPEMYDIDEMISKGYI